MADAENKMNAANAAALQPVSVVLPIMVFWFIIGLFTTIFYHLSLYLLITSF
jgi:hypothetical protein